MIDWQVAAEIATTVSTIVFAVSAILVVLQLRQATRERYFSVTAHLFDVWQSPEFQRDQLFLLHKLSCATWEEFCQLGRGDDAERSIHRVGGYYDRVGNLVRHGLINKDDILPTVGGDAVSVWHRIAPLVKELRLRENAVLFENYERLLPECHECYVPGIDRASSVQPALISTTNSEPPSVAESPASVCDLPSTNGQTRTVLLPTEFIEGGVTEMTTTNNTTGASPAGGLDFSLPDSDGIAHSLSEFTANGPAVVVYARGAWCPFCLRQLSEYAERYREFKQSGAEVVAISPESPRRSRRMRTQLKLPFTVLSDLKFDAARSFGLLGHEKPGQPTPATVVLDTGRNIRLSTLNEWEKSLLARDTLEFVRALKSYAPTQALPQPRVDKPKPGFLFVTGVTNLLAGLVVR